MGYKAEKEKMEKQIKFFKIILVCILLLCIIGGCIFTVFVPPGTWKYRVSLPDISKRAEGELRVHFIDVGQGDATLIEYPNGKVMLIDGGDGSGSASKALLRYINALDIDEINDLILTHSDADHCGGLVSVLKHKTVFNAYLPPSFPEKETKYAQFYAKLFKMDCNTYFTSRLMQFSCQSQAGDVYSYNVQCLYPYSKMVEDILAKKVELSNTNEASSILYVEYAGVKVLLMGDAPQSTEEQIMRDDEVGAWAKQGISLKDVSVLKLSHHGSASSSSLQFFQYIGVKDGIISCGKDNSYGHPAEETLGRLTQVSAKVHRTDVHSNVVLTIAQNGQYTIDYVA